MDKDAIDFIKRYDRVRLIDYQCDADSRIIEDATLRHFKKRFGMNIIVDPKIKSEWIPSEILETIMTGKRMKFYPVEIRKSERPKGLTLSFRMSSRYKSNIPEYIDLLEKKAGIYGKPKVRG